MINLLAKHLHWTPKVSRFIEWGRLITITGASQLLIQAMSLLGGILVVRLLPTHEYGFYTLANTMLGTMTVLSDGGISSSVMAQGGKVWQNREKLGAVLVTGLRLRKKFAVISLLVASPILFYLLQHHQASWLMTILIILSLVPTFIMALSGNLLAVGPALHQVIAPIQTVQIKMTIGRLLLLLLTLFVFPWAWVAVLAAGLPQIWANVRTRKISSVYADWNQKPNPLVEKEVLSLVRRVLPGSIYYCLSGQITIWLISVFGTTAAVAQIGALGRLSMMLNFFSIMFTTLIVPRFSRLPPISIILLKRYLQVQAGLAALVVCILTFVWLFPSQMLWILGKDYAGLERELFLSVTVSCTALIAGLSFNLSTCRNWAINPFISIPVTLTAIASGAAVIDLTSLRGVLTFNLFVVSVEVIMYLMYCIYKILNPKETTA